MTADRIRLADIQLADHPHTDPGDGRTECDRCGKSVWPAIHSCKGVPVTDQARARLAAEQAGTADLESTRADLADLRDRLAALAAIEEHIGESCRNASHNIRDLLAGVDPRPDAAHYGLDYRTTGGDR